ncbi:hypothetical protein C7271_23150 [filamentous cyanobacterium CCP5]|nr:hypothetical protein C7271_23150 [filamentous cyanobacterium CCP5]
MKTPQVKRSGVDLLEHLFVNGGETGACIHGFDWSTTPLGPMETWSQSLKIALQILLSSRFPMQILWGPEYIQFYNDAYIAIAGDKHPAGLGQRGEDCWREVWDFSRPLLDNVMATGNATWSEDQRLVLHRNDYPEECYFTFSYSPVWEESGTVGGIFIAVHETTQRILSERRDRQLRIETQAAKEEAERANQLKDQFLAVLSHELRSPLNPILGWANLLRSRDFNREVAQRALETIERNAKLQAQMIDDLLDISRILKNKLELSLGPVQLAPIIENALETVRTQAEDKALTLQTHIEETERQMLGDGGRLQQVIWNLLSNAVKFTPRGGQVTLDVSYEPAWAIVQVADTGKGIAVDFLPNVFDHFRQADSLTTQTFGGLGLGLAIAKQIVDMHGGTIQADSPGEGQGATFTVRLPLAGEGQPAPHGLGTPLSDTALEPIHVLVVEDDPDNQELLVCTLEAYGARVTAVASATAAMTALAEHTPDILIGDIGMADVDGLELIRTIRGGAQTSQIPAIALTAYVSEADIQRAIAAGYQAHLAKPVEPSKLVSAILQVWTPLD